MMKLLSVMEDACTILVVACLFGALAAGSVGFDTGLLWAGFWSSLGGVVLASGALLRIGPGTIAKIIKARAAALSRESKP